MHALTDADFIEHCRAKYGKTVLTDAEWSRLLPLAGRTSYTAGPFMFDLAVLRLQISELTTHLTDREYRLAQAEVQLAERDKALAAAREALTSKNDRDCGAHLPDMEVAGMVRMLMRDDLDHEMVCVSARDRIRHLSRCVADALAAIPALSAAPAEKNAAGEISEW